MQALASSLNTGCNTTVQQAWLPARLPKRDIAAHAQSNKRYSSRYTRDDTQEINSRRGNGYSSGSERAYEYDRDQWSADSTAGSWGSNEDNYGRTDSWSSSSASDAGRYDNYGRENYSSYGQDTRDSQYDSGYSAGSYSASSPSYPSFDEVMNWSGSAPEIINGRLAALGFFAAMCAEMATAEPVYMQFWQAPLPIVSAVGTITVASLMPILRNQPRQSYGPYLTPYVELVNARAAMIGFALLIIIETFTGRALFAL